MASPTIIASTIEHPDLSYIGPDGRAVRFQIVAFAVDGSVAKPITWPVVPAKAKTFVRTAGGFQVFDLDAGLASGPYIGNLSEASK